MSPKTSRRQAFFSRNVSFKWILVAALVLLVVMAAVVVTVLLVDRSEDNARRAAAAAAASTTGITSPYDLIELPADTDLDVVEDAAFVSIYVPNERGQPTGYGVNSELPAAQALIQAVKDADEAETPASEGGAEGTTPAGPAATSTITFVFATRDTLTFTLDLEAGLISRANKVWRPDGDLAALVEAAVARPE